METLKLKIETISDEQIETLSLEEANSILLEAKNKLYYDMPKLIESQLCQSEACIKNNLKVPFDKWEKHTLVDITVEGMTAKQYFNWQYEKMAVVQSGTPKEVEKAVREILFPAHPEHYTIINGAVVETLGGLPTYAAVEHTDNMPQEILDLQDAKFPMKSIAAIIGRDGNIWGYGLSEFRDLENGSEYHLRVFWPQGSPQIWFDDHARHFSVEYRNFIAMAVKSLGLTNVSVTYNTHLGIADDKKVAEWELLAAKRALHNLKKLLLNNI